MTYSSGFTRLASLGALALGLITACQSSPAVSFSEPVPVFDNPSLSNSVWVSDGYGIVIDTMVSPVRAYEATATTCLEIDLDGAALNDFYDLVSLSSDGQTARFKDVSEIHQFQYQRTDTLPAPCASIDDADDAVSVFEQMAAYFSAHYVFFDLYDVDWEARIAAFRPQVSEDMSDAALFETLSNMLAGIKDAHVELVGTVDGDRRGFDGDEGDLPRYIDLNASLNSVAEADAPGAFYNGYLNSNISEALLSDSGFASANRYMRYGMIDEEVGYLAAFHVASYATGEDRSPDAERAAINAEMQAAITLYQEQGAKAVIVDLSINFGGYDFVAREIAKHFAAAPYKAYSKQAIDTPRLIPPSEYVIEPAETSFTGPVLLLTSNGTVSGGEILTMSLRALPNVTHYGEPTRGALSDKLEKPLSNGWSVTLSNERYLDADQQLWEGLGISPDVPLTVFESEDPLASHLAAVRQLVERAHEGA
ncbi:MAG: S41 family peptidase [Pseudomonadota bacterium]